MKSKETEAGQEKKRALLEQQHEMVHNELLDAISGLEDRAGTGIVAYVLLSLGCQLSHDCCPEGEHWMELVTHVVSETQQYNKGRAE